MRRGLTKGPRSKARLIAVSLLVGVVLLNAWQDGQIAEEARNRPVDIGRSSSSAETPSTPEVAGESPRRKLGQLRDIGGGVFESAAGLHYRPGSQEGHRIKHILRHHQDVPERPIHGVFDGDRNEVFAVIDESYLLTFDHGPPRVTKSIDDGRIIYLVDLGRRIGYVGGQSGRRRNHPAANHLQLILDGTSVVTAYPVRRSQHGG